MPGNGVIRSKIGVKIRRFWPKWRLQTKVVQAAGGRNIRDVYEQRTPHGGHHDLWIDPLDNERMAIADDGGAQISVDAGGQLDDLLQPTDVPVLPGHDGQPLPLPHLRGAAGQQYGPHQQPPRLIDGGPAMWRSPADGSGRNCLSGRLR